MPDDDRAWDRRMVARVRAGDPTAVDAVYERHGAVVHAAAVRLVGEVRAADVTQDVFVHLWEHPEAFDAGRGSLRTFLVVVARRRAIDSLRRDGRASARELRAARRDPCHPPAVDEVAMASVDADRVRDAVARLPVAQRRAVELAYFEGLTYREVAVAMGAAEGTTKSRLRLALARLAASLDDGAGGECR